MIENFGIIFKYFIEKIIPITLNRNISKALNFISS